MYSDPISARAEAQKRSKRASNVGILEWPKDGLTLEHMPHEKEGPITFHSRQALRDHCKKYKVVSGALL